MSLYGQQALISAGVPGNSKQSPLGTPQRIHHQAYIHLRNEHAQSVQEANSSTNTHERNANNTELN